MSLAAGVAAARAGQRVEWRAHYLRYAPTAWLIAAARSDPTPTADDCRHAWHDRGVRRSEYYDHLLDLQADVAGRPVLEPVFVVMHAAFADGLLTPAQQKRFVEGLWRSPTVRMSAVVRSGGRLWYRIEGVDRTGSLDSPRLCFERRERLTINGHADVLAGASRGTQLPGTLTRDRSVVDLPPGRYRVALRIGFRVCRRDDGPGPDEPLWPELASTHTFDVEVRPPGAALGTPIYDAQQADAVARAVDFNLTDGSSVIPGRWGTRLIVRLGPAPVDRAFVVSARLGDRTYRLGHVCAPAGSGGVMDELLVLPRGVGEPLTLVLEGADKALDAAFGQRSYWAGRIEYAAVAEEPGVRGEAEYRPTTAAYTVTPATPDSPDRRAR